MDRTLKATIAVIISAGLVALVAYGSYLPMRKAQVYISTLQSFQSQPPKSIGDLEGRLSASLDYSSPIGQEELVRNTANSVLSLVQRGLDATTTAELVGFLDSYYNPIISSGKGMSFGQDVYLMGAVNEMAFATAGNPSYLIAAQKDYELGVKLGPNRPQALYGLFDIYRAEGNASGVIAVASTIINNWPSDAQRIQEGVAGFMQSNASSTTGTKKAAK